MVEDREKEERDGRKTIKKTEKNKNWQEQIRY